MQRVTRRCAEGHKGLRSRCGGTSVVPQCNCVWGGTTDRIRTVGEGPSGGTQLHTSREDSRIATFGGVWIVGFESLVFSHAPPTRFARVPPSVPLIGTSCCAFSQHGSFPSVEAGPAQLLLYCTGSVPCQTNLRVLVSRHPASRKMLLWRLLPVGRMHASVILESCVLSRKSMQKRSGNRT